MHADRAAAPTTGVPPLMYTDLAERWPLLSAPDDYAEEAGIYGDLLQGACEGVLTSLLELGCGDGNVHLPENIAAEAEFIMVEFKDRTTLQK